MTTEEEEGEVRMVGEAAVIAASRRKGQRAKPLPGPLEGSSPVNILILVPQDSAQTYDLKECKRISVVVFFSWHCLPESLHT